MSTGCLASSPRPTLLRHQLPAPVSVTRSLESASGAAWGCILNLAAAAAGRRGRHGHSVHLSSVLRLLLA